MRHPVPAKGPASTVRGAWRAWGIGRMAWRVARLALRLYGNPFLAATAVRRCLAAQAPARRRLPPKAAVAAGRFFLHPYVPGFPSRAFDRCVEQELDRSTPVLGRPPALRAAIVAITRRCPLRCEHCLEWGVLNRPEGLSAEELRAVARQLRQRGVAQVFFSGGEPLQRFDVLLDLTASLADEADVWVLSSGQGLSEDRAVRLRHAGLTGVSLSLDHWDPAAHDRFRGRRGSFAAVERASAAARGAGLVLALSLCPARPLVTRGNLERYGLLARSLGASFIHIYEPRAAGRYDGRDVELEPAQRRTLERWMDRVNRGADAHALPIVSYLDRYARHAGCRGASEYAYVDTDGALHPCPFCRGRGVPLLGNGLDRALADLQATGCPGRDLHSPLRIPA
jgi:MoaA/NifB/PqqE/SkfB family radical SAM enzyme